MIFSSKPALIAMERMMTQPPFYRPPGHGKYQPKKLPPDKAHYKCEYCLHYDRKKKCKLIQCPYMDERIKAGAVTLTEALVETMKDIHNIKISCMEILHQLIFRYDPSKEAKFSTYAYRFVKSGIQKYLMQLENWSISSVSTYQKIQTVRWLSNNAGDVLSAVTQKYRERSPPCFL